MTSPPTSMFTGLRLAAMGVCACYRLSELRSLGWKSALSSVLRGFLGVRASAGSSEQVSKPAT